jgi:hypothetical protein
MIGAWEKEADFSIKICTDILTKGTKQKGK